MSLPINDWISGLGKIEPPVLSASQQALIKLQSDPKVSAASIAAAILPDPMMTLRLLRLANASRRGEFSQRIETVEHSIMLLGFSTVFSRLIEAPVVEKVGSEAIKSGLYRVANRACHAAFLARDWAVQRLDTSAEEVYVAASLQGMAEMVLWMSEPAKMEQLTKARLKQSNDETERHIFGYTLLDLARGLAEQWNMPPLVISAMKETITEGQARSDSVMLANRILRNAEAGWWQPTVLTDLEDIANTRRQPLDEAIAQVHRAAVAAAKRYVFPGVVPVAAWLPMLEGEWPSDEVKAASAKTDTFQEIMDEIARAAAGESLTLSDLLTLIIRGMRDGIGLRRIVFALLNQDRTELKPRYIYGADETSPLKSFHFDMRQKHLFSVLMTKQQAVWVSDESRARYAPVWHSDIDKITSRHAFYAMSLSVHGKVVGMLYGDRTNAGLDVAGYERFKQLSVQAAQGMSKLSKAKV